MVKKAVTRPLALLVCNHWPMRIAILRTIPHGIRSQLGRGRARDRRPVCHEHDEADLSSTDTIAELQQAVRAPVPDHRVAAGPFFGRELDVPLVAPQSVQREREDLRKCRYPSSTTSSGYSLSSEQDGQGRTRK